MLSPFLADSPMNRENCSVHEIAEVQVIVVGRQWRLQDCSQGRVDKMAASVIPKNFEAALTRSYKPSHLAHLDKISGTYVCDLMYPAAGTAIEQIIIRIETPRP